MRKKKDQDTSLLWNVVTVLLVAEMFYCWHLVENGISIFADITFYSVVNLVMLGWILVTLFVAYARYKKANPDKDTAPGKEALPA